MEEKKFPDRSEPLLSTEYARDVLIWLANYFGILPPKLERVPGDEGYFCAGTVRLGESTNLSVLLHEFTHYRTWLGAGCPHSWPVPVAEAHNKDYFFGLLEVVRAWFGEGKEHLYIWWQEGGHMAPWVREEMRRVASARPKALNNDRAA